MGLSNYLKPIPKVLATPSGGMPMPGSPSNASGLAFLKARAAVAFEERYPEESSEIKRVINLATHYAITSEELEAVCAAELNADAFESGWRLHPEQAALLLAYDENSKVVSPETPYGIGCFGPIGCGRGKTLATQMLAERGWQRGIQRSVLFIPAKVYAQFFDDLKWARTKVPLSVYFHRLSGVNIDADTRQALVRSRKPGCYVVGYELFSRPEQSELLESIEPGLILTDEAHNLADRKSSRTKRYLRYVEEFRPQCVAFSGTMTGKSIKDFWHIIKACLRLLSPLPVAKSLMEEWAMVLDSDAQPSKAQALKLRPLVEWVRRMFLRCPSCFGNRPKEPCKACRGSGKLNITEDVAGYRKAFTLRLNTAPGVVASPDDIVGASLVFENKPVENPEECPGWKELQTLIEKVENEWITPGGEDIEYAIHCYKWLYELSAGFYNELFWPTEEVFAKRKGTSAQTAKETLDKAKKHHAADVLYKKELRNWLLDYSRPKLDSPMLLGGFMHAKGAPPHGEELYRLWRLKKALAFPGMPERDSRAVRICDYKIRTAAEWAKTLKGEGGLVWIYHEEIGEWVVEVLREAGLDVLHCPAGERFNEILSGPDKLRYQNKVVIASIKAHGEGKNLQHFWNQYVLQWPRGAKTAEQLIARTHREGQKKDELTVHTSNTTTFDHGNFYACLNDALYIHQTGGGRQRLIYGRYNPLPKIYPPEWLRERGFEIETLTKDMKALMQEKFGTLVTTS